MYHSLSMPPTGLLLSNLGSPDAPRRREVASYLRRFLTDPRAVDLPWLPRQILVRGIIAPFRSRRSARAYAKIWTAEGSPLVVHTLALAAKVGTRLGPDWKVVAGMRTGKPSLESALDAFQAAGCRRVVLMPLYPQYASATVGSTFQEVWRLASLREIVPEIVPAGSFFDHPAFLDAVADRIRRVLEPIPTASVLFSFHGLPQRQILKADRTGTCLGEGCCERSEGAPRGCYKAQCHATARELASRLHLAPDRWKISFQSRLGRDAWIGPSTADTLSDLAARGTSDVVVATPSFVADCLETLEEIGIGLAKAFESRGGTLHLVPCLNTGEDWVDAVAGMALSYLPHPR
ncbi:MAG TPA: ferrochelatase [Fibrobacteria bacterium]|nr:ferrochelatase [Fibrobacteria bacterium]